jgi:hypothetical protein
LRKRHKRERRRILKIHREWREVLGLDGWETSLRFTAGGFEVDGVLSPQTAASARVRWQYRQATLEFNLKRTRQLKRHELEAVYVHEAMHVLVNELREKDHNLRHEEHAATNLSWALIRARNRGR